MMNTKPTIEDLEMDLEELTGLRMTAMEHGDNQHTVDELEMEIENVKAFLEEAHFALQRAEDEAERRFNKGVRKVLKGVA